MNYVEHLKIMNYCIRLLTSWITSSAKATICAHGITEYQRYTKERDIYLEYANPVLWMWFDELRQGIVTFQCGMGQVTLAHVLEDDVGKV